MNTATRQGFPQSGTGYAPCAGAVSCLPRKLALLLLLPFGACN